MRALLICCENDGWNLHGKAALLGFRWWALFVREQATRWMAWANSNILGASFWKGLEKRIKIRLNRFRMTPNIDFLGLHFWASLGDALGIRLFVVGAVKGMAVPI